MIRLMFSLSLIIIFYIPMGYLYAEQEKQAIKNKNETIILDGNNIKIISHWTEEEKKAMRQKQDEALEKTYKELMQVQQTEEILIKIDDFFSKQTKYLRRNNCGNAIRVGAGSFNDVRQLDAAERIEFNWFQQDNFKEYTACKEWGEFFGSITKHLSLEDILRPKAILVEEYYRDDGAFVRSHYRSAPDSFKWNNFGPSLTEEELLAPYNRDYDHDGIPNFIDIDDDADGILDDWDTNQFGGTQSMLSMD